MTFLLFSLLPLGYINEIPVIFRYDLDWGSQGARTSLLFAPAIDLRYFFIVKRSLGLGTLLVLMDRPPGKGHMNLAHKFDLIFFRRVLIWKIWELVSPIITSVSLVDTNMIACFLEEPFIVGWIFFPLLIGLEKAVLLHCKRIFCGK